MHGYPHASGIPDAPPVPVRSGRPIVLPARPVGGPRYGLWWALGLLMVAVMLVLVGVPVAVGTRLDTATIVGCAVLAFGAAALFVLPGRVGSGSVPDRLTVAGDRIELLSCGGTGRQWRRADGALVRLTGTGRTLRMTIGTDPTGVTWNQLRHFEVAEVRAACLAHGWSWREGRGAVLAAVDPAVAVEYPEPVVEPSREPELVVVLRDGHDVCSSGVRRVVGGLFGAWLVVLLVGGWWLIDDRSAGVPVWVLPAGSPVLLLAAAGCAVAVTRRLAVVLVVRTDEVVVRHGGDITVVDRAAVSRVTLRGRRVVFHGEGTRGRVLGLDVPRDSKSVLTGLDRFGWPVDRS